MGGPGRPRSKRRLGEAIAGPCLTLARFSRSWSQPVVAVRYAAGRPAPKLPDIWLLRLNFRTYGHGITHQTRARRQDRQQLVHASAEPSNGKCVVVHSELVSKCLHVSYHPEATCKGRMKPGGQLRPQGGAGGRCADID